MAKATSQPQLQQQLVVGNNIACVVDGTTLTLTIDLSTDLGPSKSGLSDLVASTGGASVIGTTGVTLNLTAYRKKEQPKKA